MTKENIMDYSKKFFELLSEKFETFVKRNHIYDNIGEAFYEEIEIR